MGDGSSADRKFARDWGEERQAPTGQAAALRRHAGRNDLKVTLERPWRGFSVSAL